MNQTAEIPDTRFAAVYGSPGETPRVRGLIRVFWPLLPICTAAGWLLRTALPFPALSTAQTGLLFIALAIALGAFLMWSTRRLQSFIKGAEGEVKVARLLTFLPGNCTVFNNFMVDGKGIDHIVIAPAGIFAIETKNWRGAITFEQSQVRINNRAPTRPPLQQTRETAAALRNYLDECGCPDTPVHPVLCFVDNEPEEALSNVGGVRITSDRNFYTLFENGLEDPLPAGTRAIIVSALKKQTGE